MSVDEGRMPHGFIHAGLVEIYATTVIWVISAEAGSRKIKQVLEFVFLLFNKN